MLSAKIKEIIKQPSDIIYFDLFIGANKDKPALLIGVDGMVNLRSVNEDVIKPLMEHNSIFHAARKEKTDPEEIALDILAGNAALVIDAESKAIIFDARGFSVRGISEPDSETVLKGPKDSFIEAMRTNTALIRRRINSPRLRFADIRLGKDIGTNATVVYLEGAADEEKVAEVLSRLENMSERIIKSTASVEESLADRCYSIFPQVMYTERPDKLCANICEGKIGILVDGYPVAFVVPAVFNMLFQAGEDYSQNYAHGSYIRVLRYVAAFLSLIIPGFYVAITNFHHEMLPTHLMRAIIESKRDVSFTTFLEVFSLLIAFEILVEAGIRLPKSIGQAVSIIGGLVVGEAAVGAKIISPAIVVVVAVTGICGFVVCNSDLANAFRITRILLLVSAGLAGLYGLSFGIILMTYYLCSLTSAGEPYMRAYKKGEMAIKDGIFRLPKR